jgi:hypothetical protein
MLCVRAESANPKSLTLFLHVPLNECGARKATNPESSLSSWAGLLPGHLRLRLRRKKDVDHRVKPGDDGFRCWIASALERLANS